MSLYTKIFGLCLISLTLGFAGCDAGGSSEPAAASQDELTQFLADNPDIANAPEDEVDENEE